MDIWKKYMKWSFTKKNAMFQIDAYTIAQLNMIYIWYEFSSFFSSKIHGHLKFTKKNWNFLWQISDMWFHLEK